jgi:hypothetical protein
MRLSTVLSMYWLLILPVQGERTSIPLPSERFPGCSDTHILFISYGIEMDSFALARLGGRRVMEIAQVRLFQSHSPQIPVINETPVTRPSHRN